MESLQIAQILADLNSLNAADNDASKALVTANKHLSHQSERSVSVPAARQPQPEQHPSTHADASGRLAPPGRPAELVRSESCEGRSSRLSPAPYGGGHHRRMLTSPPLTRSSSTTNSIPGTPRRESDADPRMKTLDDDGELAAIIMNLYKHRAEAARARDGTNGLARYKEKVDAVAERHGLPVPGQQPGSIPAGDDDRVKH